MKISLKGLAEFFPQLDPQFLLQKSGDFKRDLPLSGIEIGGIRNPTEGLEKVCVAKILEAVQHPKADRLRVCKVERNPKEEPLQIVCGAPNARAGIKVALAPVGSVLPGNFAIKESEIRGVVSRGMLCSGKELGLSEESDGILELPDSAQVGTSFVSTLGLDDQIWEVELTPDRGDCLSHFGMAREIGRLLKMTPEFPEIENIGTSENNSEIPLVNVEVQNPKACKMYLAQLFEGFNQKPSPNFITSKLNLLGIRTHNAIVDITNFILMELGHPLHAFDADKVQGRILVRNAKLGEKLKTLDGVERKLSVDDLVIADSERVLALAGVMGGEDSAVSDKTTRVILECALFDPEFIRATAKRHKISSDSSYRFERGVDPSIRFKILGRAALLFKQVCGARRRGAFVDVLSDKSNKLGLEHEINLDLRVFRDVSGIEAQADEISRSFQSVGISSQVKSPNLVRVVVPPHRFDLNREVDLIEEGARLLGYSRIPPRYPAQVEATRSLTRSLYRKGRILREAILARGLTEIMPYAFLGEKEIEFFDSDFRNQFVDLENPLSADWATLRPSLCFGIISSIKNHLALGQMRGGVFDLGSVFCQNPNFSVENRDTGVDEFLHVGWGLFGERKPLHWSTDKSSKEKNVHVDFFDGKSLLTDVLFELQTLDPRTSGAQIQSLNDVFQNPELARVVPAMAPWIPLRLLHPGKSALIYLAGQGPAGVQQVIGFLGELHPFYAGQILNLPTGSHLGCVLGELRLGAAVLSQIKELNLGHTKILQPKGKALPQIRFPVVERDLALKIPRQTRASDLDRTLRKVGGKFLVSLQCIDRFENEESKTEGQWVSLAFRAQFQSTEATLKEEEISSALKDMIEAAKSRHQAELR